VRLAAPERLAARAQLAARPLGPRLGGDALERLERGSQLIARVDAPPSAAQALAVAEPCAGQGERALGLRVQVERLLEVHLEPVGVREQPAAALRVGHEQRNGCELRAVERRERRLGVGGPAGTHVGLGELELGRDPGDEEPALVGVTRDLFEPADRIVDPAGAEVEQPDAERGQELVEPEPERACAPVRLVGVGAALCLVSP
jgi:hypothetical protein